MYWWVRGLTHACYLSHVFGPVRDYRLTVKAVMRELHRLRTKEGVSFGAIAFMGESGASLAYALKYETGIPIICVRKKGGQFSHGMRVEGPNHAVSNYVIVDDFIDSGKTIKKIVKALKDRGLNCVGIIEATGDCGDSYFDLPSLHPPIPISSLG